MAALAMAGALASCARQEIPPAAAKVTVVDLTMTEYRFDYRGPIPAGRVVVSARNVGHLVHELILVRLSGGPGPRPAPGATAPRQATHPLGYLHPRDPGARGTFAVDVARGRYLLTCSVRDADGTQHDARGMHREFVVR